jgi:hypothetical protein
MNEQVVIEAGQMVRHLIGDRNVDDLNAEEVWAVAEEYVSQVPDARLRQALTLATARNVIKWKSPEAETRFRAELDREIAEYAAEHGLGIPGD